jgi:Ca-activated chloride channel family protein
MNFQHPWFLLLLLFLPFIFLWLHRQGKHKEATLKISSTLFISKKMRLSGKRKDLVLKLISFSILILIILGLARPQAIGKLKNTNFNVIDLLLIIDISSSMLADDFLPNRLEAVKVTASDFIRKRNIDRIGILVFAGETFIQCPLTTDSKVLLSLVKDIEIADKEYDGTAIGMAIANGTNRLRNSNVNSKVMILLSDGTNNSGEIDPKTSAQLAAEYDIKIYTIGAGTNQSYTSIPGRGMIVNEIDEETLKFIAKETNGKYFRATDINGLSSIYDEIDKLERSVIEVKEYNQYTELYGYLLFPAFLLAMFRELLRLIVFKIKP